MALVAAGAGVVLGATGAGDTCGGLGLTAGSGVGFGCAGAGVTWGTCGVVGCVDWATSSFALMVIRVQLFQLESME